MKTQKSLIPYTISLLLLAGCMMTEQHILYDNKVPIAERSERYQDAIRAGQESRRAKEAGPSEPVHAICEGDARFTFAWTIVKPAGPKENTCFWPIQVECETPGLKYRFGSVQWQVGDRRGTLTTDENGGFFVPLSKSELQGKVTLRVGDATVTASPGPDLELKVSEKICRKK